MPLALTLSRGAVDADLGFFFITDNTGLYDVNNKPGGYGAPNPARNTLALYVYGYQHVSGNDDTVIAINNTIPATVTEWQINDTQDKYRYFKILGIPIWTTSPYVFNVNNPPLVYYNAVYYKCLQNSTNLNPINNPLYWEPIVNLTTPEIYANTTIHVGSFDIVTNWNGKKCYQTQMFLEAKDCGCNGTNRAEVRPFEKIFVMLYTAGLKCAQQQYIQADELLTELSLYCQTLNCDGC